MIWRAYWWDMEITPSEGVRTKGEAISACIENKYLVGDGIADDGYTIEKENSRGEITEIEVQLKK